MGYKLKHIHAFKRVCKDLWKYSKEQREAGGILCIRDITGAAHLIEHHGLCYALVRHHTETGGRLGGSPLSPLPYHLYGAYNEQCGYLPGALGVWTPERVALLKFYCTTPAKELLKQLEGSAFNRGIKEPS